RRLPAHYRLPLVMCYFEGLHHDEVAQRLGCAVGTVESRLSRARERLRVRLTGRGLAPAAPVLAMFLVALDASAAAPSLIDATVQAAVGFPQKRLIALTASSAYRAFRRVAQTKAAKAIPAAIAMFGILAAGWGANRPATPAPSVTNAKPPAKPSLPP